MSLLMEVLATKIKPLREVEGLNSKIISDGKLGYNKELKKE
jgi:hypothetical protein